MNRLFEIAVELGEIADKRIKNRLSLVGVDLAIEKREAELIPDGGWPGSNADTRKTAEKTAKAADHELNRLINLKGELQYIMDDLELQRQKLIDERNAWEWTIRDSEQEAIGRLSVFVRMDKHQEHVAYIAMNEPDPQPQP